MRFNVSAGSPDVLHRVSPPQSGFRPYICKGVHFADRGESLVVTYTESHTVMKYIIEPWTFKSSRLLQTRIGFSFVDGDSLFVSNLSNGVDLYSLRTMQRLRHYEAPVTINVPLQIALARQNLDRVVVGGVDGAVRVYDRSTGELVLRLEHKVKGRVQVVDAASTPETELIAVASSSLGQNSIIQLWHLKGSPKLSEVVPAHCHPPKAGYLQQVKRWLYFLFIIIVVNVFLVFLLLHFIIIPYLIKVGDIPNNLSLYKSVSEIFSPIPTSPTYTSATSPSLPQDVHSQRHTVIYL
jgi:WD40 repeat protein